MLIFGSVKVRTPAREKNRGEGVVPSSFKLEWVEGVQWSLTK